MLDDRLRDDRSRVVLRVLYRGAPQPCLTALGPFLELTLENDKKRITSVFYLDTRAFRPVQPEALAAAMTNRFGKSGTVMPR
jgi:hypothetical protein